MGTPNPDDIKENPIIVWLRAKMEGTAPMHDQKDDKQAAAVETSSDTVHSMADGGEVPEKKDSDYGTLVGLREMLRKNSGQPPEPSTPTVHMADGGSVMDTLKQIGPAVMSTIPGFGALGDVAQAYDMKNQIQQAMPQPQAAPASDVDQDFVNKLNAGMNTDPSQVPTDQPPSAPPINSMMQNLNKTPETDYNFYKNISAEDRAHLMQQLIKQQHSGGNLIASGAAGLGDAIARSFGHQNTDYQKDVEAGAQQATDQKIGVMDTQRNQRLQDLTANQQSEMDDPNSKLSMTMRQTFKSAGINVPSGMPASIMMKIAPDIGNLALKQAVLQQTGAIKGAEMSQRGTQMQTAAAENATSHPIQALANSIRPGTFPAMQQVEQAGGIAPAQPLGSNFSLPEPGQSVNINGVKVTRHS